jgi:beta-lactamase regulating signal transducer with metallopeptidase domain
VEHLLNWLWQGSVVALATSVILRLLTRARAQIRYVLCWIVLGVVLTLPVLPLLFAIDASFPQPVAGPASGSVAMIAVPDAWWTSATIVLSAWAVWSGVHAMRIATAVAALRRARGRCRPFPATEESRLAHWNGVRARGRRTRLVLSEDVRAAAMLGCGSPVIAIAPALVGCLDREELDRFVIHEWTHVQRRDDLLHLAQVAVQALAGWHPAVWWLNRQLQIERESACDEATIALTGSAKSYAAALAKAATLLPATRRMVPAVGALSSPALRVRIIRILSHRRLVSRAWSVSTATTAALTLLVLAFCIAGVRLIGTAVLAAPFVPGHVVEPGPIERTSLVSAPSVQESPSRDWRPKSPARRSSASGDAASVAATVVIDMPGTVMDAAARPTPPPAAPTLDATSFHAVPITRGVTLGAAPPGGRAPDSDAATPWGAAADTGVAVGRASQRAATATAGFFSRLGKKIAGSF